MLYAAFAGVLKSFKLFCSLFRSFCMHYEFLQLAPDLACVIFCNWHFYSESAVTWMTIVIPFCYRLYHWYRTKLT